MNDNYIKVESNIDIIVTLLNSSNIPAETKTAIIERLNEISNIVYEMC